MIVTSDLEEFVDALDPADVLLFDGTKPASALIKFAENRPVNHCALHMGGGNFLNVTSHERGDWAVQPGTLRDRFALRSDRAVTAMRRKDITPDGVEQVLSDARDYQTASTSYAYLNLVSLLVPCFCRAYAKPLRQRRMTVWALERTSRSLLNSFAAALEGHEEEAARDGLITFTCSEFIYACFLRAGRLETPNSLAVWRERMNTRSRGGAVRGDEPDELMGAPFSLDFNEELTEELPVGAGEAFRDVKVADVARAARRVIIDLCNYNVRRGKYRAGPPTDAVVQDVVTPGDLWTSPSVVPVALLRWPEADMDDDETGTG